MIFIWYILVLSKKYIISIILILFIIFIHYLIKVYYKHNIYVSVLVTGD